MAEQVVEFGKDGRPLEGDGRLDAPAFHRNHQPIRQVLQPFLAGKSGDVVEAGSGTGQHVTEFARLFPDITWWPSDLDAQHLRASQRGARIRALPTSARRCASTSPIPPGVPSSTAAGPRTCLRCSAPT